MASRRGRHALLLGAPLADGFRPGLRAIGSAGERLVHTEEVTGSIPVSPTISCILGGLQVANRVQKSGPSRAGPLGASWEEFGRSTSHGRYQLGVMPDYILVALAVCNATGA